MTKFYIFIIISILISSSIAKQKPIEYLGKVKIEDLFIRHETNKKLTKKETVNETKLDKFLMNNEDLELESLEVADIDIATFGEYENFLNKYYDENFVDLSTKSMKQIGLLISGSAGSRIPFGANARATFNSGLDLGLSVSPKKTFEIFNYESTYYTNLNITHISPINNAFANFQITRITFGTVSSIKNNFFIKTGLSLLSSKGGTIENPTIGYGSSINFDIGYKLNLIKQTNIGLYVRGQSMLAGSLDPPIDGAGTLETISVGVIFDSPLYLVY